LKIIEKLFNFTYEFGRILKNNKYPSEIHSKEKGNTKIKKAIMENKPFMVTRFGTNEINYAYRTHQNKRMPFKFRRSILNAGVYPLEEKVLKIFSEKYLNSIKSADFVGVWNSSEYEGETIKEFCPDAFLAPLTSIEPYYFEEPWSEALRGKTVLVVSPFKDTIEKQYLQKDKLFRSKNMLPNFNLVTYKSVQSIGGNINFKDWNEALLKMEHDIFNIKFDIAIIGAGAYGLPLAAFIKKMGKISIHMGGATQLLFGIKGRRWENHKFISKLFNEKWVYPSVDERPGDYKKVEGGCYW
jgi:hypothetical protein